MNYLVKQLVNDDGDIIEEGRQRWHVMQSDVGDVGLLCSGEFVDDAASSGNGESYIFKSVRRGGVTCEKCLSIVRTIKAVKL